MKKLASALEVIGWFALVAGVLIGLQLASGAKDILSIIAYFALGALPGAFALALCLAHKHYLTVAENFNNYLMLKGQQTPGMPMPPIPQPFPAQFAPQAPVAPQPPMQPMQPVQPPVQTPPQQ